MYTVICGAVLRVEVNVNTLFWGIPCHRLTGELSESGAISGFDFQKMFRTAGYEMRNWIDACIGFWYARHVWLETTGLSLTNIRAVKVV